MNIGTRMDDEYASIIKKPLKLAADKDRKKRSKTKQLKDDPPGMVSKDTRIIVTTATKAEQAFKSKQEKIAETRILKKASKTHKQRVEEFNKHLDSLSEHYDIPKVSWTK